MFAFDASFRRRRPPDIERPNMIRGAIAATANHPLSQGYGVFSVSPPSTMISAPVTYFASSEARYSAA